MYKPCSFDRKEYLSNADYFEDGIWDNTEADSELDEFNDNTVSLAVELSHTRYALAKAEKKVESLKKIYEDELREICIYACTGVDGTECEGDTGLLHCPAGFAQAFTAENCPQLKK